MDSEMTPNCSLPPLVEGKTHGYLKLDIDEIVCSQRASTEIVVLASWWGESHSARFRPLGLTDRPSKRANETTQVYAIKTNISLFREYIKNCETLQLVVLAEKTDTLIGIAHVTDLFRIFTYEPLVSYVPVLNSVGDKVGVVRVALTLLHVTGLPSVNTNVYNDAKSKVPNYNDAVAKQTMSPNKDRRHQYQQFVIQEPQSLTDDGCTSILKSKRTVFQDPIEKSNVIPTNDLVVHIAARARRLRDILEKGTCDHCSLSSNPCSPNENSSVQCDTTERFYKYISRRGMKVHEQNQELLTLGSTSSASNLINLGKSNQSILRDNLLLAKCMETVPNLRSPMKVPRDGKLEQAKDNGTFHGAGYMKISIKSFRLSSAGYRRVKSTFLSCNENILPRVTYLVQCDAGFEKCSNGNAPVKIPSKKQDGEVIYFDHTEVYSMSKLKLNRTPRPNLKLKLYIRHSNRRTTTELGSGIIDPSECREKSDVSSSNRSVPIMNKGIKVGELNISIEFGSNYNQSEIQYLDAIISSKENLTTQEANLLLATRNCNNEDTTSNRTSSNPTSQVSQLTANSTTRPLAVRSKIQPRNETIDGEGRIATQKENWNREKISLHGLICITEGRDLPELKTYLTCRAFWKTDQRTSIVSIDTTNPIYNFQHLVPLVCDDDLLNRMRNSYIIVEVYSKVDGLDNLLGLAKLPVHQLYLAYSDSRVLPNLLSSKFPVISVDGWVPIVDPITRKFCGKLFALVALGTARQIELLSTLRQLHDKPVIQAKSCADTSDAKPIQPEEFLRPANCSNFTPTERNIPEEEPHLPDIKVQGVQTDISTVYELKLNQSQLHHNQHEQRPTLDKPVADDFLQALPVNKLHKDQAAQTELVASETPEQSNLLNNETEEKQLQGCRVVEYSVMKDTSDATSIKTNSQILTEAYRSVGVGAEYDEELCQRSSPPPLPYLRPHSNESELFLGAREQNSKDECDTFRVVIDIECALHLPSVDERESISQAYTYVTFRTRKFKLENRLKSYAISNLVPYSCNPKWNWKYETRLPTELLLNNEKRLIVKIWQTLKSEANFENDTVIGFAAVDLSVLINGFPKISGWFHIMDFTGKCNGQLQVNIMPLEDLSSFIKLPVNSNAVQQLTGVAEEDWMSPQLEDPNRMEMEKKDDGYTLPTITQEPIRSAAQNDHVSTDSTLHLLRNLEDVPMSVLTVSLKQKLRELDQITKRLETRLRDVTNTAFDDDFDNEFDLNDVGSDNENAESTSKEVPAPIVDNFPSSNGNVVLEIQRNELDHEEQQLPRKNEGNSIAQQPEDRSCLPTQLSEDNIDSGIVNDAATSSRQSSVVNTQHDSLWTCDTVSKDFGEYPERGTKVHINHLLNMLSLQPVHPVPSECSPAGSEVINLLRTLHQSNNRIQHRDKCRMRNETPRCTVPTQTDVSGEVGTNSIQNSGNDARTTGRWSNLECEKPMVREEEPPTVKSEVHNRMSTVIREELLAEDNSELFKSDDLSTYLISSNLRHMKWDHMSNPLMCRHFVPDLNFSAALSPDGEAAEQLDDRYTKTFATPDNAPEASGNNALSLVAYSPNSQVFRMTPSGISEDVDGNIDLTVIHNPTNDDLFESNISHGSSSDASTEKCSVIRMRFQAHDSESGTPLEEYLNSLPLSRQAPEGGNPIEEAPTPLVGQVQLSSTDPSTENGKHG